MDLNHGLGKIGAGDAMGASLVAGAGFAETMYAPHISYRVECVAPDKADASRYIRLLCDREEARDRGDMDRVARLQDLVDMIGLYPKWVEEFENHVTTQGKAVLLDVMFGTAGSTTQITAWFCGLISSVSYSTTAIGDTAAQINGTNGWKEAAASNAPNYSAGTRAALSWAAASGTPTVSKATASAASFSISGAGTVKGCFVISNSTKDGTSGILYSAGVFSGGDKVVGIGDTLNVTGTLSVA